MSRLAIITTAYNHARFLPECLASIDAQTSQDFVHIVVNDASPDDTAGVLAGWASDTARAVVTLPENRGLAAAFHAGVAAAPSWVQWFLKVDADDRIDNRYVAAILRAADEDPSRNVIFAPAKHFGARHDAYVYPPFVPAKMRREFYIPGPAAYKRTLWDAVGGYDVTMRSAEDWDFYIRAHEAVGLKPYQIREPDLYWWYRVHDGPRASSEGMARLPLLHMYWDGHTSQSASGKLRTWGAWCADRGVMA